MKKFLSLLLLLVFNITSFQILPIYAQYNSSLEKDKQKNIEVLDKVEKIIDKSIDKIDEKIKNEDISKRLREKEKEIEEYIEDTQDKIEQENSKRDIKKLLNDAKKTVVLKVVSGITKYRDIEENIDDSIKKEDKKEAKKVIQESLELGDDYSFIVKTKFSKLEILKKYKIFDEKLKVNFLYNDGNLNYFEFFVSNDSIFRKEMLEDVENGNIPEKFLGVEIVKPEVFSINENQTKPLSGILSLSHKKEATNILDGENLDITWGVKKYEPLNYLSKLKNLNKKIRVGVIDTGIDYNHPDLKGRVSGGYDFVNKDDDAFDDQGHGTHVSGTIGAGINGKGIIGVNPFVELVPLKICNSRGFCPSYAVIKSLEYAKENKIDILNMSLGGRGNPSSNPICDGIESLTKDGIIVVSAAGNSNVDTSTFVPGGCRDSISVAALQEDLSRASFSNYGQKVDISAAGVGVYSTIPNSGYRKLSGTSMATPHIVGLISVIKSFKPDFKTNDIKDIFKNNNIETSFESGKYIAGFPDLEKILSSFEEKEKIIEDDIEEEPLTGILSPLQEKEATKDDAEIVEDIEFVENQEELDKVESVEFGELPKLDELEPTSVQIDFGDKDSGIDTNSIGDYEIEEIEIEEVLEEEKEYFKSPEVQYFTPDGKVSESDIEINSVEEELKNSRGIHLKDGEEIELNNIYLSGSLDEFENLPETIPDNEVNNELFIDGADNNVEINSVGEEDLESVEINNSGSGNIINSSLDDEIIIEDNEESFEKNIDEEKFLSENKNLLEIEQKVENIDNIEYTKELILDGAEKGVEINSIGEDEEIEIKEYGFSKNNIDEDIFEGEEIKGADEITIENEGNFSEDEIIDIEENIEVIEEPKKKKKFITDFQQNGVEINNISEEDSFKTKVYTLEVEEGKSIDLPISPKYYFYNDSGSLVYNYYRFNTTSGLSGRGAMYSFKGGIRISGYDFGKSQFHLFKGNKIMYTFNVNILPKPPKVIDIELYEGKGIWSRMHYARFHDFTFSSSGKVKLKAKYYSIRLTGIEAGELKIYAKYKGVLRYILNVKILPKPVPKEYDITVAEGKKVELFIPKTDYWYYFRTNNLNGGSSYVLSKSNKFYVVGKKLGNTKIELLDSRYHFTRFIFNVKITPKPPVVYEKEVYETRNFRVGLWRAFRYNYTFSSKDNVKVVTNYTGFRVYGEKAGYTEIYVKYGNKHIYTFKVKILKKPETKVYNLDLNLYQSTKVILPENIDKYIFRSSNSRLLEARKYSNYFYLKGKHREGKVVLHLIDRKSGFDKYTLNINIKIPELHYTIIKGDTIRLSIGRSPSMRYENYNDKYKIVYMRQKRSNYYLTGLSAGRSVINYHNRGGTLERRYIITVKNNPDPIQLDCEIQVGKSCYFKNDGDIRYHYTTTNGAELDIREWTNAIRLTGRSSGQAQINILSSGGTYIKYQLNIKIHPNPPLEYKCKIPATIYCKTYSLNLQNNYTYKTTNPGISKLTLETHKLKSGLGKYQKLKIQGTKPGTTKIYIYYSKDHIATIQVEVGTKPEPLKFSKNQIKIKQEEEQELQIENGHIKYLVESQRNNGETVNINLNNNTGKIILRGKKEGNTYIRIVDKYNESGILQIITLDTKLILETYNIELEPGETRVIKALEHYNGIKQLQKNNNNITVKSSYKQLEIQANYSGQSLIKVIDGEGNEKVIKVIISGDKKNPNYKGYKYRTGIDNCPKGDTSGDLYDDKCEAEEESNENNENNENENENKQEEETENSGSNDSEEIDEIEKELDEIFKKYGININNIPETNNQLKINSYLLNNRYNKLLIELRKTQSGRKLYTKIAHFGNQIKGTHPNKLETALEKIDTIQERSIYKTNHFFKTVIDFVEVVIQIETEDYWRNNPEELKELRQDLIKLYTSIGLDITGLKSTGEGLGSVITFWVGYVKNDPYLKAQAILQKDLKAVGTELNPLRKFEKLKKIGEKIKGFKKTLDFSKISTKISSGHAFGKHLDEFKKYGIDNNEKFKKYIENTLKNSKFSKNGDKGRKIFYNEKYKSVVIYDPHSKDLGTTFIPSNGKKYFDNFK